MKHIAVIGAGISGLAAASLLSGRHRVDLFEQERRLGGHTNTVLVEGPNGAVPSDRERDVFSCFTITTNIAWLHTDASMLPVRARARASWNYRLAGDPDAPPTVTYDLNRLQGLTTPEHYCVTLNPDGGIDERQVLRRLVYRHPLYTREAVRAQRLWGDVSGVNRTHYCGAYWRYGFHEDGLHSALRVAHTLGVEW